MDSLPSALTTILQTFQPLMRAEVFTSFGYLLTRVLIGEAKAGTARASVFAPADYWPQRLSDLFCRHKLSGQALMAHLTTIALTALYPQGLPERLLWIADATYTEKPYAHRIASVDWFHRELGKVLWEACGMARNGPGLEHAMAEIAKLHERFKAGVKVLGDEESLNQSLEKAGRVADFFELAELMCRDARAREESCGCHFREEHQTPDQEALRNDDDFAHVAAWEYPTILHKESLAFHYVHPAQRSYK